MLSIKKIKLIKFLESKKGRKEHGLFLVEGDKMVSEMISSGFPISYIAATEDWFTKAGQLNSNMEHDVVSQKELDKISFLKTPQNVLCVAKIPDHLLNLAELKNDLVLLLDTIQDPGNLGTIIRIADWFGIEHIICSIDCSDAFNPKVVQATMGSICRVKVYYEDFKEILKQIKLLGQPIYGTTLKGENIYQASLTPYGFIMMGNESKGINSSWINMLDKQLFIPFYPTVKKRTESLNVASAAAILCAEFRRRLL
jgi:RNA methyltransferase, TrmH family